MEGCLIMKKHLLKKVGTVILSLALIVSSITFTAEKMVTDVKAASTTSSTLVWSDEFNGNSIDTSKWGFEIGTGASGWGNNEQQYYTDRADNAYVSDGSLHIRAKKESYGGMRYTSARLNTNGKFTFTYGYVEARIALPSSQGIWPAFWMLGANIGSVGWPSCGEIDIMEAINAENKTYATCHWNCNGHAEYGKSTGNFDITQYHTYGLQWDKQYIRMFVDGNKIYEMYIENNTGDTEEFQRPFYLLLNVAVGGNWPGFSIDDNAFPTEMKVDYVRVYQENPSYSSSSSNNVDGNNGNNSGGDSGNNDSTPASGMGMDYTGANTATVYVNDSSWTDIHYSVNGGGQQNVRMTQSGSKAAYTINGLNAGDTVKYWFTYCNTSGFTKDTEQYTYTHKSGNSSGGSSSDINTASGDVYIYQDINYGGRTASLGEGSYNLASLQAKGFQNDDLSSIKVPFGYKVTLYENDNFSGSTKIITSDISWIGNDFNDKTSSIKIEKAIYKIINKHSGKVLDVSASNTNNGANVQQWDDNGTNAQKWYIKQNSDFSYTITSVLNGKALDVDAWSTNNGANIQMWDCGANQSNQQWWLTQLEDGYTSIINKNSNKCLDVSGWSVERGANVQQYDYSQQANQLWKFEMVN